jgi:hypothetical protein
MNNSTVYTVSISFGEESSSVDMDKQIYDLLFYKNYTEDPEFTTSNGGILIKFTKDENQYFWKVDQATSEILKKEYSLDILDKKEVETEDRI